MIYNFIFFCYVALNLGSLMYLEQILLLHLKIPKSREDLTSVTAPHVGDRLLTFSCSASTALP